MGAFESSAVAVSARLKEDTSLNGIKQVIDAIGKLRDSAERKQAVAKLSQCRLALGRAEEVVVVVSQFAITAKTEKLNALVAESMGGGMRSMAMPRSTRCNHTPRAIRLR